MAAIDRIEALLRTLAAAGINHEDDLWYEITEAPEFSLALGLDPDQPWPSRPIDPALVAALPERLFNTPSTPAPPTTSPTETPRMPSWTASPSTPPTSSVTSMVAKLVGHHVHGPTATKLAQSRPERTGQALDHLAILVAQGRPPTDVGAWLVSTIRADWPIPKAPVLPPPRPTPEQHAAVVAQEARQQALRLQKQAQEVVLVAKANAVYEGLKADALTALEAEALALYPHLAKLPPRDQVRLSFIRMGVFLIIKEKLIAELQPT